MNLKYNKWKILFRIITLSFFLLFSESIFCQENFDGYLLCKDNSSEGYQERNDYYYIPIDYLKNSIHFDKENIEYKDDEVELKIRASNGLKFYKYIFTFENEECVKNKEKDLDHYSATNLKLVYFHYKEDGNLNKIKKEYFLKKIKHNKYYLGKIKLKGCKLIDKDYLKSKVLKIFVYEIEEIVPPSDSEKKQIIKYIQDIYSK